jgi:hypothetical protein
MVSRYIIVKVPYFYNESSFNIVHMSVCIIMMFRCFVVSYSLHPTEGEKVFSLHKLLAIPGLSTYLYGIDCILHPH